MNLRKGAFLKSASIKDTHKKAQIKERANNSFTFEIVCTNWSKIIRTSWIQSIWYSWKGFYRTHLSLISRFFKDSCCRLYIVAEYWSYVFLYVHYQKSVTVCLVDDDVSAGRKRTNHMPWSQFTRYSMVLQWKLYCHPYCLRCCRPTCIIEKHRIPRIYIR